MPVDFPALATYLGVPGALLAVACVFLYRMYRQAVADNTAASAAALAQRDAQIERLADDNKRLQERLFAVLEKGERLADLAGAPPAPAVRRRRQEV